MRISNYIQYKFYCFKIYFESFQPSICQLKEYVCVCVFVRFRGMKLNA